ncbi:MAG: PAS domain S-box protein [Acidobacteria bacterium]|nr:PAS domain S-box protein [Acidobacteriota bacterium]
MVQFNTRANEILLKLVYYGPGLSGKTTNLQMLHAMCADASRGEMFSVNTQEDRTLFFDLLPINLGYIYGNAIHLQVYTVPGQVQYDASRRVVLGGADGVVFVADSSEAKMQENVDSLSNLYHNLNANRLNIKQIPFVLQYNKRDLADAMPVGVMNRRLNFRSVPYFEGVACKGTGVLDTFLAITRDTVGTTFRKYHLDKKIKDFDEMLNLIETNIRSTMQEPLPTEATPAVPDSTVLRHSNVSVADLVPGKVADAQELLEDALKSNMETARLYSELKQTKETLEKKNDEMAQLFTQLERANQDNLKTRRYLEGLIQSVGEAIISFAPDGKILTWNSAAERIFGFARTEIVGRTMQQLTPPSRLGELDQAAAIVSKGQILRDVQTTRLRKDGLEFPVSITYAPVRGADDKVLAFSAVVRDLGEKRELQRRLEDSENRAAMGRLLPGLFNDLANRLSPILMQARLLQDELQNSPQSPKVNRLSHAVESVQTLMRPLLVVLMPSTPQPVATNLSTLVREACRRVEPEAAASGVSLEFNLDPQLPEVGLDPDQMGEALVGLVRNSICALARAPVKRVRIGTRKAEGSVQLVVQDTAPALTEAQQAGVFKFAQAPSLEALGPVVAAAVVQAHKGRINVRSQEGIGNAYLAEFPIEAGRSATPPSAGLEGRRVLVVDDEPILLEVLTEALVSWGCTVVTSGDGQEAVRQLGESPFDLVVSDIRMPGIGGIELYEWMEAQRPELCRRLLFTTGDSFDQETRQFLDRSGIPFLGKPFDLKKFKQGLERLLAGGPDH